MKAWRRETGHERKAMSPAMELETTVGFGPWAIGAQTCQRKGCSSTQGEPESSSALEKMLDVGSCHKQRTSSAEVTGG